MSSKDTTTNTDTNDDMAADRKSLQDYMAGHNTTLSEDEAKQLMKKVLDHDFPPIPIIPSSADGELSEQEMDAYFSQLVNDPTALEEFTKYVDEVTSGSSASGQDKKAK